MSKVFPTLADWAATAFAAPDDALWRLQEDGYQAALEHQVETRFAISNGFLGVRGSLEQPMVGSRPRTFIAGLFDTAPGEVPLPKLVSGPDWLRFQLLVAGEPLALEASQTLTHGRTIDMWRGVLRAEWRQRDPAGRVVRLRTLRFVSLANRALAVQVVWIAVVQPTPLALEAWIEPPPGELYLTRTEPDVQVWRTAYPAKQLAVASTMTLRLDAQKIRPVSGDVGRSIWRWNATPDQPAIVATGSPFPDVRFDGRVFNNSQCNNVLIFPGVGLGILAAGARRVTDAMFVAAAHALSEARQAGADMLADAAPAPAPTETPNVVETKAALLVEAEAPRPLHASGIPRPPYLERHQQQLRAKRKQRYDQVVGLHQAGSSSNARQARCRFASR